MTSKLIGLTGGIGSGKSKVGAYLEAQGFPLYIADNAAKELMHKNEALKASIIALLGEKAYRQNQLNHSFIAERVFGNPALLQQLNALVHPAVAKDFSLWKAKQKSAYVIKEAAILFETGGAELCDIVLLITAPEPLRINRVMQRDGVEEKEVRNRMARQWPDEKKIPLAHKVIENIDWEKTQAELDAWIKKL